MFAIPVTVTVAVVLPIGLFIVAETLVMPPPCLVVGPLEKIVATGVFEKPHLTSDVIFAVVPLLPFTIRSRMRRNARPCTG
jgi:hypothetical protein